MFGSGISEVEQYTCGQPDKPMTDVRVTLVLLQCCSPPKLHSPSAPRPTLSDLASVPKCHVGTIRFDPENCVSGRSGFAKELAWSLAALPSLCAALLP